MSFANFTANEMWYERYMENKPDIAKCEQCSHACVCWKVGMDAAQYCEVFESKTKNTASMKLKELLPFIHDTYVVIYDGMMVDEAECLEDDIQAIYSAVDEEAPSVSEMVIELEEEE